VVAITGCTTGTGYVAAQTCLRKGAHVVMLNRKSERVDAAVKSLAQEVPGAKLTAIECNLADFDSVRSAAAVLNTQFADTGIDVICNNAGVMALADQATKEGYDIQMQTVSSKTSAPICP
jgi:NAD(P)-dependent dehydrogenase (short-subunit alcohol dehydrogenase family)